MLCLLIEVYTSLAVSGSLRFLRTESGSMKNFLKFWWSVLKFHLTSDAKSHLKCILNHLAIEAHQILELHKYKAYKTICASKRDLLFHFHVAYNLLSVIQLYTCYVIYSYIELICDSVQGFLLLLSCLQLMDCSNFLQQSVWS